MWTNPKFEQIYNRQKQQFLFYERGLTEEDLSSNYLDGNLFKKTTKKELIAYERGVLRGIKLVDNMLSSITLDPLESPEARFKVIQLYAAELSEDYEISESLDDILMIYPEHKIVLGWSIYDTLMNKQANNTRRIYFSKKEADEKREELIKQKYKLNN